MRLKEESAVVTHASPVSRPIGHTNGGTLGLLRSPLTDGATNQTDNTAVLNGTQWITNYETQATTDNHVVSNCTERHQQYITGNTLDNAHSGIVADGNSNGVAIPTLAPNQVEAALRANGRLLVSSDQETSRNVVLMPLACSPADNLLISTEGSQLAHSPAEDDDDSSEDSSSSTCSSTSSDSALSESGGQRRRQPRQRALRRPRAGILNPNYPGFQRYANRLQLEYGGAEDEDEEEEEEGEGREEEEDDDSERQQQQAAAVTRNINNPGQVDSVSDSNNNNNNNEHATTSGGQALNQLDGVVKRFDKSLSCEGVATLNIPPVVSGREDAEQKVEGRGGVEGGGGGDGCCCLEAKERNMEGSAWADTANHPKMADAHLSGTRDEVMVVAPAGVDVVAVGEGEEDDLGKVGAVQVVQGGVGMCKKEKMEVNRGIRMARAVPDTTTLTPSQKALAPAWAQQVALRREQHSRSSMNRRSMPEAKERARRTSPDAGGFDVYNIETAMPSIDLDAIETHLKAAEERRVSSPVVSSMEALMELKQSRSLQH